jgi:biopolymer transport protein TolR
MWQFGGQTRKNGSLPVNADINVTSLVDVAFTLLVIFIITAPILQGGVEVQLPQTPAAPITSSEGVIVTVTKEGQIFVGDVPVSGPEEFRAVYTEVVKDRRARDAYVKGDKDVPYGQVMLVLGLMKELDVAEVGLVADPTPSQTPPRRR